MLLFLLPGLQYTRSFPDRILKASLTRHDQRSVRDVGVVRAAGVMLRALQLRLDRLQHKRVVEVVEIWEGREPLKGEYVRRM